MSLAAPGPAGVLAVQMSPADAAYRYWLVTARDLVCLPCGFVRGSSLRAEANTSPEVFLHRDACATSL